MCALVLVPLVTFVIAYVMAPTFSDDGLRIDVLPAWILMEALILGIPTLAILAFVRRRSVVVVATLFMALAAIFGVVSATGIHDGQAGLALLTPLWVGCIAAPVLGICERFAR